MANTKQVHVEAFVPFDWASNLTAREAQCWAAWVLGPNGLKLSQQQSHYQDNDRGGRTCMYRLELKGTEAINNGALAILADSLRKQPYAEVVAESRDLDARDHEMWYTVPTVREDRAAQRRAAAYVEKMMEGKKWETTQIVPGISEARLVDA